VRTFKSADLSWV